MEKKSEFYCENQTYTELEKALHTNSIKYFWADLFCIQGKIINSLQTSHFINECHYQRTELSLCLQ